MRIIALALGWLLGLYVASRLGMPIAALAPGVAVGLALAVAMRRHWRLLLAAMFVAGLLAGALRFELGGDSEPAGTLAAYAGEEAVDLRGIIESYPAQLGSVTRFRLKARELLVGGQWQPASGKVQVTARETQELVRARRPPYFRVGDLVQLHGRLERPRSFGDFDFPAYLAQQGIQSVMAFPDVALVDTGRGPAIPRALFTVRSRLSRSLSRVLPEPQNGVAQSIVLGIRTEISPGLTEEFQASGASHLLAISGLHTGILMVFAMWVSRRLLWRSRLLVYLSPVAVMWLYVSIAGLPPSAERAAIMGSFYLAALYFGRQRHGWEALLLAALVITAFDPRAMWQVSAQLSFLAMAGIVMVLPAVRDYLPFGDGVVAQRDPVATVARAAVGLVAVSAVATLFTLPAIAFYFHRISLVGVLTSTLTLPLLPLALMSSVLTAAVGLVSSQAAWLFGAAAWFFVGGIVWFVQLFASLPLALVRVGDVARWWVVGYYVALAGAVWGWRRAKWRLPAALGWARFLSVRTPGTLRISRLGAATLLVTLLAALVWLAALLPQRDLLEVTFFDVGHGDAVLIKTPSGRTILVDGGPDPRLLTRGLSRRLPFWYRRIDLMVLTHPERDHVAGLSAVLERYDVRRVLDPGLAGDNATYEAWLQAVRQQGIPRTIASAGQRIVVGEVTLDVLHPPARRLMGTPSDTNNNSVVLRLSYGRVSFLLTGDIQAIAETYLVGQDAELDSVVLKVAHHGSDTSSTGRFLEAVHPVAAVITVDAEGRYGHPTAAVVQRLEGLVPRETLFNTALDGAIRFRTDGNRLWVTTDR
ncbi:MAG: DNA internalization-related competence protein ComEC/Rec2 [Chloroflexi bacterium]|nr:DNA internalization-related competence protein ComEC/Rec2 [Chloroflexota bacterium]